MTDRRFSVREIVDATGLNQSTISRRVNKELWPYTTETVVGGTRRLYSLSDLPKDIQQPLILAEARQSAEQEQELADTAWKVYERAGANAKAEAKRRLEALLFREKLTFSGLGKSAATDKAADEFGANRATIYKWVELVKGIERSNWLAHLLPQYEGKPKRSAECTPEAWDFFKADYLRNEQPSIASCYERLKRAARANGWAIPAIRTFNRWCTERIPLSVRILRREGEHALSARFPSVERTVRNMHALEWINGDGYQHNVFVKWPDGTIDRPKTWFWQDVHARKILSYRVDLTENTDSIRLSFGDLVEQFGIPSHATIDNTRAAANKWMTGGVANRYRFKVKEDDPLGIFPLLGVQVHWTSVDKAGTQAKGRGQAKPIERAFGVGGLGDYVDQHPDFAGAYTGKNVNAKPENYASKAIPLEDFVRVLNEEILHWNAREGRRTEMAGGTLSFDQVFNESYAVAPIRKATEAQRRLWLLTAESIRVDKTGCFTLEAGARTGQGRDGRNRYFAQELLEYGDRGIKIVVRFDPDHLHESVYVYTLDGRFITTADCLEAKGFGDSDGSRIYSRERKKFIKATKAAADAEMRMDLAGVSQRLPRPELPAPVASKVVRPARASIEMPDTKSPDEYWTKQAESSMADVEALFEPQAPQPESTAYQRWLRVSEAMEQGETLSQIDAKWWTKNEANPEFTNRKLMEDWDKELERTASSN
ncbi:MAG: transposase domain-containing protein [Zhongshania sp.]|uniref:transposase domain-containing protein n=1 Tax=Zhongshania sp. TaxID=1971902 RepID=UPI00260F3D74|nr:transposase domain-containing protein [Zhongshania sp.]MDF1691739.1 transposase domain-containing protein [Zhongshania sp.]